MSLLWCFCSFGLTSRLQTSNQSYQEKSPLCLLGNLWAPAPKPTDPHRFCGMKTEQRRSAGTRPTVGQMGV